MMLCFAGGDPLLYAKITFPYYNRGVQPLFTKGKVILWQRKRMIYHTQNGCVNITLFSLQSIDEK